MAMYSVRAMSSAGVTHTWLLLHGDEPKLDPPVARPPSFKRKNSSSYLLAGDTYVGIQNIQFLWGGNHTIFTLLI